MRTTLQKFSQAIISILLALVPFESHAVHFLDIIGLGGSDGHIAKIKYRLRESFFPTNVAWSEDGNYIASASSQSREIHIWDVKKNEIIRKLHIPAPPGGETKTMVWTIDGKYLAVFTGFGELPFIIFNVDTGVIAKKFSNNDKIICTKMDLSHDGKRLAIIGGNEVSIINTENFNIINQFEIPKETLRAIRDLSWLPDNKTIIIGGYPKYEDAGFGEKKQLADCLK